MGAGLAVAVAGCGGGHRSTTAGAPDGSSAAYAGLPLDSHLLTDVAEPLTSGYAASGSLYFTEPRPVGEHVGETYDMHRILAASGRMQASHSFGEPIDDTLLAGGSLWVTTSVGNDTVLWRMVPGTLTVRSRVKLPSRRPNENLAGTLAVAGGALWVGAGTLDRVSLSTGRVTRVLNPPVPGPVQVAGGAGGRILMASFGWDHPIYIARLNPVSGREEARVAIQRSFGQPTFAGVIDGGAWLENNTGPVTRAVRVDVRTLKLTEVAPLSESIRRMAVHVSDGTVWISEPDGSGNLNYCANPITGRAVTRSAALPGDSVFLTALGPRFFYTDVPVNAHAVKLESAPIAQSCRG